MHSSKDILKVELIFYVGVWTFAVLYSIYSFTVSSNKYFRNYNDAYSDFTRGWSFISRKKDNADFEWQMMKFLFQKLYSWIILSSIVSEILRKCNLIRVLQLWQILVTIIFILKELGAFPLVVILFQPFVFAFVRKWRNRVQIWLLNTTVITLISFYKYLNAKEQFLIIFKLNERYAYITIVSIFWMNLRCVSYCLDFLHENEQSLLGFFSYCLYLPNAFCGPFIPYKDFKDCHKYSHNVLDRILGLLTNILRFIFWMFFAELCLHFIYVNAAAFHPEWVASLDSWALYGYGYTMGQFFHIKYLVLYGLATSFAKFENIKVPSLPVCIGRIYLYSDMWKYFDAGLYNFLLRYIYLPTSKIGVLSSRPLSSFLCFFFVYVWHGTDDYILIWTVLNYIGVIIENFCGWLNNRCLQDSKFIKKIGHKWFRRITCLAASPLLAMSAVSNFYFFARSEIGCIFVNRIFNDSFFNNAILFAILYTSCQSSMEIRKINNQMKKTKTYKTH